MNIKILSKSMIIVAIVSTVTLGVGDYVWKQENRPKVLEIYVFAMKSGRSIFVRTPEDKRILIDGGANSDIISELTKILPFYSRRIDSIIATNSEGKDMAGLIDVLDRYNVGKIYMSKISIQSLGLGSSTDQIYGSFVECGSDLNVPISEIDAGRSISFDPSVTAEMLFPVSSSAFSYSKASPPELLMEISYKETSVVLLGNASVKVQKYLASSTLSTPAQILIVSHSALPANMSDKLVQKLRPQYLVYSKALVVSSTAPKKTQKKPVVDPLSYLPESNKLNIKKVGTIHLISDGRTFRVSDK